MAAPPRIGFLGAGMMAEALAKGFIKAGVATAGGITATDISQQRKDVFAAAGMGVVATSREVRPSRSGCRLRLASRLRRRGACMQPYCER
jgi:pyrroline-5-carboxylate reductase